MARAPHVISSLGLGSCVAVTLYDRLRRVGGVVHIMLPDSNGLSGPFSPYRCADTAIAALIREMQGRGAAPQDMVAKMVGGARMFDACDDSGTAIGEENVTSVKRLLIRGRIPLMGEDTGRDYGRNIEFHLSSGKLIVSAIGKENKVI